MRPKQWVKNLFVLVPIVFAQQLLYPATGGVAWAPVIRALVAFGVFCLASGAVYLLNDLMDIDRDRAHPTKRNRPLASGALPIQAASLGLAGLAGLALLGAYALGLSFTGVVAGYFGLNLLYSLRWKHIPYLDVFSIASGFLLRVAGGALAISVPMTSWLYATTFLLSSFLALGKRVHELRVTGTLAGETRRVLARYRVNGLTWAFRGFGAATAAAYVAYTLSDHAAAQFRDRPLGVTIPFIVVGLWRFAHLTLRLSTPESPTDQMLRDALFLTNLVLWVGAVLAVIYG